MQFHLLFQAIDEDRSDARALLRPAGFLLNDRSKDDELFRRTQRQIGLAILPCVLQHALLRLLHQCNHALARGSRAGSDRCPASSDALARDFLDVAGQHRIFQKPRDDLLGGQTFGNRDGMLHNPVFDQHVDDLAQAGLFRELIFAVFEFIRAFSASTPAMNR